MQCAHPAPRETQVFVASRSDTLDANCINSGHSPGVNRSHVSYQTDGSLIGNNSDPFQASPQSVICPTEGDFLFSVVCVCVPLNVRLVLLSTGPN